MGSRARRRPNGAGHEAVAWRGLQVRTIADAGHGTAPAHGELDLFTIELDLFIIEFTIEPVRGFGVDLLRGAVDYVRATRRRALTIDLAAVTRIAGGTATRELQGQGHRPWVNQTSGRRHDRSCRPLAEIPSVGAIRGRESRACLTRAAERCLVGKQMLGAEGS